MPAAKKTNSKLKGKQIENSDAFLNFPMNGIFNTFNGQGSGAAASNPFELMNNNSYILVSLNRILLTYAYVLHGVLRTLVDQPVYDGFRGGIMIKSDEVSPEEIEDLHREMKKLKLTKRVIEALRWDRLYGGAGIIINTSQDFKKPFNVDTINEKSKIEFIAADRWELGGATMHSSTMPMPTNEFFDYYGRALHVSRVSKIVGEMPPSLARQRLQGWGMSVIECVLREINMYFKNNNVIFELLDEAKIDVWKIKGFNAQVLSALAQQKTSKRIQMATYMKNFLNAITLDKEDDYEQKTMTFTGLSEMLEQIRIGIASAVRMPMAKIFGLASKGFASGEDDIENYNTIVEGQRDRAEEALEMPIQVVMMKVWGFIPDDWSIGWKPLRVLSAEQEQNVLNSKFERASSLFSQGILNPQEYCAQLKTDGILLMETEVAKGADPEPPMGAGQEEELALAEKGMKSKPSAGKKPAKAKE